MQGGGAGRGRRPNRGRGAGRYVRPPWPVEWMEGGVEWRVVGWIIGGGGGRRRERRQEAKSQVDQVAGADLRLYQ